MMSPEKLNVLESYLHAELQVQLGIAPLLVTPLSSTEK